MKYSTLVLLGCAVIFMWFAVMIATVLLPPDSTDPVGGRSGLTLYTDALTGCQYARGSSGGTVPRYGRDGRQICEVQK